ncbi:MAG: phenylalanine--tRNA ligase subunit beta [Nitrososphaerota archaeon]|jgi:phenylalanyl-tRNA synthetase beta chain|nr:phenylalanine--tRNA ligase subunit beta [Nitrososphaerota archaeon]
MPTIDIEYKELQKLLSVELDGDMEKLDEILAYVKAEVKGYNKQDEVVNVEFKDTNRPDLWSVEGLARALRGFIDQKCGGGIRRYVLEPSGVEVFVSRELFAIRPYIACAVVKNVELSDASIRGLMHLQEKLDQTYGHKRQKASVGIYNIDLIKPPIEYTTVKAKEAAFIPLGFAEKMTADEILEKHPKGCEYGHIIKNNPSMFPMLFDADGKILSFPPIINSNDLGKVTVDSKNLLIEVTGTIHTTVLNTLNIVTTMLIDQGGKAYSTIIHYPDNSDYTEKQVTTPNFNNHTMKLSVEYTNKILGLNLTAKRIAELLKIAGLSTQETTTATADAEAEITALIPCYRTDIMHQVDLIEDIAIAYGYNNITPNWREIATIGKAKPDQHGINLTRDLMIGLGYQEILNTTLTNKETLFNKMNTPQTPLIELDNPKVTTMTCLRNWLLPQLVEFLSNNKSVEFPQKIYEIGKTTQPNPTYETKIQENETLAAITTHPNANFSEIKSTLDSLLTNLGIEWQIKETTHPAFIEGRTGQILINKQDIGIIGEISPQILENWNLENPAAAFEINLQKTLKPNPPPH